MSQEIQYRTIQRDGRTWKVDNNGITDLKRRYTVVLNDDYFPTDGELSTFAGVPTIGSVHPTFHDLSVVSYDVSEGQNSEKKLINITVNYSLDNESENEETLSSGTGIVEEWGWEAGTESREVTNNLYDGQSNFEGTLLNSAGDPFANVPTCESPAPVFVKIIKTTARQDWLDLNCKINKNAIQIGSMNCPSKTLLAVISEKRIFDDDKYKYRYTINLKYKSNMSLYGSGTTPIQFGWDIPVVDAGMRELVTENNIKVSKVIMSIDKETNQPCAVTSAELLDGSGGKATRDQNGRAQPYIIRVQAYEDETFPSELYSEPS